MLKFLIEIFVSSTKIVEI